MIEAIYTSRGVRSHFCSLRYTYVVVLLLIIFQCDSTWPENATGQPLNAALLHYTTRDAYHLYISGWVRLRTTALLRYLRL